MKKTGIYLHFPFCRRRCFYCHFFKVAYDRSLASRYIAALVREIELKKDLRAEIGTVYIGGGSPSLLAPAELGKILAAIRRCFAVESLAETTLEANPEDLSGLKLRFYRRAGINRLSIGVQSFCDMDLLFLKRNHTAAEAEKAIDRALAAGYENINADLMIGLPGQTLSFIDRNVAKLRQLSVPHVSVYLLEGVARGKRGNDDSRDHRLYHHARRRLDESGYRQYEVSNFSREGARCRHNLAYWQDGSYIGIGASAAGYGQGTDYRNRTGLAGYLARLEGGKMPATARRLIDPRIRRIITGLRLTDGIPAALFDHFPDPLRFLLENGLLIRKKGNIAVPPKKILLLNEILGYFLPD